MENEIKLIGEQRHLQGGGYVQDFEYRERKFRFCREEYSDKSNVFSADQAFHSSLGFVAYVSKEAPDETAMKLGAETIFAKHIQWAALYEARANKN